MLTILTFFILVIGGMMAGLIQYYVDFKQIPLYQPSPPAQDSFAAGTGAPGTPDRWSRLIAFLRGHWQFVGYQVIGIAGAFLVPAICKLTNLDLKIDFACMYSCKCAMRGWNMLILLGYGIISGYSSVRLLRNIGGFFLSRVGKLMETHQQSLTTLQQDVKNLHNQMTGFAAPRQDNIAVVQEKVAAVQKDDYLDETEYQKAKNDYYKGTDLNDTSHLFATLNTLVNSTHSTTLPYQPSAQLYPLVDKHPDKLLYSIYSNTPFTVESLKMMDDQAEQLRQQAWASFDALGSSRADFGHDVEARYPYNCEHVVPQSWFGKKLPMVGDLHHLFTCEIKCNSLRANDPYYDFPDYAADLIRPECGKSDDVQDLGQRFEPERNKGVVARAVLYFLVRYPGAIGGKYTAKDMSTFLDWNRNQPVTEYEKHRNQTIQVKQGNRNPFIDFPELAEKLNPGEVFGASRSQSLTDLLAPELAPDADDTIASLEFHQVLAADDLQPCPERPAGTSADAWRVAECLKTLLKAVNVLAPGRNKASDGTIGDAAHQARKSDHNPWVWDAATARGVVTALDVTQDPAGKCDCQKLADSMVQSKDPRVKYIIWNKRIANSSSIGGTDPWSWRPYAGQDPHTDHIHISVKCEKDQYDNKNPWTISLT